MLKRFNFSQTQVTIFLILVAFAFSFAVRLLWVAQFADTEQFQFNGQFMINTNDGYYWAEGARDILAGTSQPNDLSPTERAASQLTAWVAKIVPFSFETVIFYLPAFLSSLVVIPIVLVGKSFGRLEVGFVAALLGSIAWSYYNRTMVGYYDTDMLNIVFPALLLWSLIYALRTREEKYLLFTGLEIIAYRWWYPQSYALEFAFFGLILLYALYLAYKRQSFAYELKLLATIMFAMVNLHEIVRFILVLAMYEAARQNKIDKYIYYIFGASVAAFFLTGGFDPIWKQLQGYVFRDSIQQDVTGGLGLHFFSVMQTVREAGAIPFETFANRISGHTVTFILSIIGYIWFTYHYRAMLLALPMVGLGFLAYGIPGLVDGGGLRFTIYAVPPLALGLGYLIYRLSGYAANDVAKYSAMAVLTIATLYPNIKHVQAYKVPTVFNKQEVQVLDRLKNIADREDYAVAWWDYGYPLRYYSDVKTLIDGGKHKGKDNFPVSFALTQPVEAGAKMARLEVEYTEKRFAAKHDNSTKMASSNIEQMTLDYGLKDPHRLLNALKNSEADVQMPDKTRNIYLYLPHRMLNIFPTVQLFSNLDLNTGKQNDRPFFYQTASFKEEGNLLRLGRGIKLEKDKGIIHIGQKKLQINKFVITAYDKKGRLRKTVQKVDEDSPISVIYMKNYNKFLVLQQSVYESLYIQLFVLENYSGEYVKPVILSPLAKVYKLQF